MFNSIYKIDDCTGVTKAVTSRQMCKCNPYLEKGSDAVTEKWNLFDKFFL